MHCYSEKAPYLGVSFDARLLSYKMLLSWVTEKAVRVEMFCNDAAFTNILLLLMHADESFPFAEIEQTKYQTSLDIRPRNSLGKLYNAMLASRSASPARGTFAAGIVLLTRSCANSGRCLRMERLGGLVSTDSNTSIFDLVMCRRELT